MMRYHITPHCLHCGDPLEKSEEPYGEWVRYEDHAAALDQRDQRIAELEGLLSEHERADEFLSKIGIQLLKREDGSFDGVSTARYDATRAVEAEGVRAALATPEPRDATDDQ